MPTVSEMMKLKRQKKQNKLSNKRVQGRQIKSPLLIALNDIGYKCQKNTLTLFDTQNLLLLYQHTYFVQSISEESGFNWLNLAYLNKCKKAIETALLKVLSHCEVNENGELYSCVNTHLTVYKQTRYRILYFIVKIYERTAQVLNNSACNKRNGANLIVAKHLEYAKKYFYASLQAKESPILKFLKD